MARGRTSWTAVHADSDPIAATPDDGSAVLCLGADSVLVLAGGGLPEDGSTLRELVAKISRTQAEANTTACAAAHVGANGRGAPTHL